MIRVTQKGDFGGITSYLKKSLGDVNENVFHKYGAMGVEALSAATPVDTGKTAGSWSYEVVQDKKGARLIFKNSNVVNGTNIAMILQYGHATRTGGWVEGLDYINPAIRPVFEKLTEDLWKEVTSV